MKTYPIDKTLRVLELIADTKGLKIEDSKEYVDICDYLTCREFGIEEGLPLGHDEVFDAYQKVFDFVLPGCSEHSWEFHRRCQKL